MTDRNKPWMKFFPTDWQADPALGSCSLAARGLWQEMLCIMHKAEPYGHLLVKGKPPSVKTIASLVRSTEAEVLPLLQELEREDVFSRKRNGVIFSRRMERDEMRSRKNRDNGKMGGNPTLSKDKGKNNSLKPQRLEARGQKLEKKDTPHPPKAAKPKPSAVASDTPAHAKSCFDRFWEVYPKRQGANPKGPAAKKFELFLKQGKDPEEIIGGASRYAAEQRKIGKIGTGFIAQAVTWLNQTRWEDYPGPALAANGSGDPAKKLVFVAEGSPGGDAWQTWYEKMQIPMPGRVDGGWMFSTPMPPSRRSPEHDQPAAEAKAP